MKPLRFCLLLAVSSVAALHAAIDPASIVPAAAPRTLVLAGRAEAFRAYCTTGEGAKAFAKIRADFDREYLNRAVPAEPLTYGDPTPTKRTAELADAWRAQHDVTGLVSGIAEAAALCWVVTGDERYFAKAREILLATSAWKLGPPGKPVDWRNGPVPGATDILYNDEAHFRLWRKMPLVYDQIRSKLSSADRAVILAHFKARGTRSVEWLEREGNISQVRRNSIDSDLASHPVRFMPMTGLAALALWDDLPEARTWWNMTYTFYRDQFTPWGGDDGGWGEGVAYWRGTFEHAAFQDALLALGDPIAYDTPFWKNSPLFAVYNVQPYQHTTFGDVSNAGRFNLEPTTADYLEHLARVQQNGVLLSYAALSTDRRPRPLDKGIAGLDRNYPTATEILVRNFVAAGRALPAARPLSELPPHRYFADVGWVSLHSALGRPAEDIHVTFRASPYGSFSHSHADQLGFILNAYGEGLAIASAYREYHNSPHHDQWTRQSQSKNVILIDGVGQLAKSKDATGRITRFEQAPRTVWTTGDATAAYQAAQKEKSRVQRVTRDLVFVDQRYVIVRDRIVLATPGRLSWLLHGEKKIDWSEERQTATIEGDRARLDVPLVAAGVKWRASVTTEFPVPVDPKYPASSGWRNQAHFTAESVEPAREFTVFAVLYPHATHDAVGRASATLDAQGALVVRVPNGKTDTITLTDTALSLK